MAYPKKFRWAQYGTHSTRLRAYGIKAPVIATLLRRGWIRKIHTKLRDGLYEWVSNEGEK
jgi:hypothetical protein